MARLFKTLNKTASSLLRDGGIGVIPTDTIYGIVGSALNQETVKRIYSLRERNLNKPMIILIGSIRDLEKFGVVVDPVAKRILHDVWPASTSVILSVSGKKFEYLHRGTRGLAFRLPAKSSLRRFLASSGPLVAPSANKEGMPPAKDVKAAKKYFGDEIDFYVSAGKLDGQPSRLISIKRGAVSILR